MTLQEERRNLLTGIISFAGIVALLWVIKSIELFFGISFSTFGILPLQWRGLPGILFSPLLHADLAHITANSPPLFLLGAALVYYYRKDAFKIFSLMWIITGIWVWLFARGNSYHIGASGVVYALAAFHFASGVIRREPRLMAFSMLIIFLYGSMVWGIFPEFFPKKNISWESHLMGVLSGLILAYYYRDTGPQRKQYQWDEEEDTEEEDGAPTSETIEYESATKPTPDNEENEAKELPGKGDSQQGNIRINYEYLPKKKD